MIVVIALVISAILWVLADYLKEDNPDFAFLVVIASAIIVFVSCYDFFFG